MHTGDSGVNVAHAMKIALVHDVTEAIVGDITPHCGVSKEEKFRMEKGEILIYIFFFPLRMYFIMYMES